MYQSYYFSVKIKTILIRIVRCCSNVIDQESFWRYFLTLTYVNVTFKCRYKHSSFVNNLTSNYIRYADFARFLAIILHQTMLRTLMTIWCQVMLAKVAHFYWQSAVSSQTGYVDRLLTEYEAYMKRVDCKLSCSV